LQNTGAVKTKRKAVGPDFAQLHCEQAPVSRVCTLAPVPSNTGQHFFGQEARRAPSCFFYADDAHFGAERQATVAVFRASGYSQADGYSKLLKLTADAAGNFDCARKPQATDSTRMEAVAAVYNVEASSFFKASTCS
jgi:hypothetical protein